jgi:hypothetical protein
MYTGWLVNVHKPTFVSQTALAGHWPSFEHVPARATWQTPMFVSQ